MKNRSLIAACLLALMLGACQPASLESGVDEVLSGGSEEAVEIELDPGESGSSPELADAGAELPDMPAPDMPPATEVGAISLPDTVYRSSSGYSVTLLTPAQYDAYLPSGDGKFPGIRAADSFLLGQGGTIAVANAKGKIVTDFSYEPAQEDWNAQSAAIILKKGRYYGAVSALDGTEVVPFRYSSVVPVEDSDTFLLAQEGETLDLYKGDGTVALELYRGNKVVPVGEDYLAVLADGTLRIYETPSMEPMSNFGCAGVHVAALGRDGDAPLLAVTVDGKAGLCTPDGTFVVKPAYDYISSSADGKTGDYFVFIKNGKSGVLDRDGKTVVKAEWDDIVLYRNGARICKDDKWGVIRDLQSGEISIEPIYDYIFDYGPSGYAAFERNGRYGTIDREGNEIIGATYSNEITDIGVNLEKGYFSIRGESKMSGIVGQGKTILAPNHYIFYAQGEDAYHLVMTQREKWGYINRAGQFVIDAKYENASEFIPGADIAFVKQGGKVSLINRAGKTVLDTDFSNIIAYNPQTMVCVAEYTNSKGEVKCCLVKMNMP